MILTKSRIYELNIFNSFTGEEIYNLLGYNLQNSFLNYGMSCGAFKNYRKLIYFFAKINSEPDRTWAKRLAGQGGHAELVDIFYKGKFEYLGYTNMKGKIRNYFEL